MKLFKYEREREIHIKPKSRTEQRLGVYVVLWWWHPYPVSCISLPWQKQNWDWSRQSVSGESWGPRSELCNKQNLKSGPRKWIKPRSAWLGLQLSQLKFYSKSKIWAQLFAKSAQYACAWCSKFERLYYNISIRSQQNISFLTLRFKTSFKCLF